MLETISIQDYRIAAPLLRQIIAKMDRETLVRLYLTSTWGKRAVEVFKGAEFEQYVAAKRDEFALLKLVEPHPSRIVNETVVTAIIVFENRKIRLWKKLLDDMQRLPSPDAEFVELHEEKMRKCVETRDLARKTKANWNILHGDDGKRRS